MYVYLVQLRSCGRYGGDNIHEIVIPNTEKYIYGTNHCIPVIFMDKWKYPSHQLLGCSCETLCLSSIIASFCPWHCDIPVRFSPNPCTVTSWQTRTLRMNDVESFWCQRRQQRSRPNENDPPRPLRASFEVWQRKNFRINWILFVVLWLWFVNRRSTWKSVKLLQDLTGFDRIFTDFDRLCNRPNRLKFGRIWHLWGVISPDCVIQFLILIL